LNLTAEWNKTDEALHVAYRLQNPSRQRMLCFTRLFREKPSGQRAVDPKLAFVEISREGHVRVDLLCPEVPEDIDVEYPVLPYAVLLEPGAQTSGEVVLPLPLAENRPYQYGPPKTLPEQSKTCELRVGYLAFSGDEIPAKPLAFEGKPIYSVRSGVAFGQQKIVATQSVPLVVSIARNR